ncbi:scavenger receptor cysteine-rich domain-containing protein SCART1-like [Ornithorhynchus anatinus]|uniref:scavenger receptor cysteine-rich domain-containing protein SCART1-like n=1 Tax=Ornithorhynchus anatinus TaxID=9258 RepID=UPI0019D4A232|nr:scavenger receptor cysteine-rich domain-containing protein SCART1-like [Ornithorhynchus anatinus]
MLAKGNSPCAGFPGQLIASKDLVMTCDFQSEEATVLCRELGCGSALQPSTDLRLREDLGNTSRAITCQGTEPTILDCFILETLLGLCNPDSDPQVICSGHREVRLVGGEHPCAGRLEVRRGLEWGTVCQSDLDLTTAHVVCRELRCGAAVSMPGGAHFGRGLGPLWTQETFRCQGNESLLFHCPRGPAQTEPCSHRKEAAVRCSEYRLVNGSSRCEGRVELQVGESWGPLCAVHWDLADAHVLCRQLGCGPALGTVGRESFGAGDGPAWTDAFHCAGTEPHLWNCPRSALGAAACQPNHVATAICSVSDGSRQLQRASQSSREPLACPNLNLPGAGESAEALRLQGGQSRCDGRVEISLRGSWSRIMAEAWGLAEAGVVCHQLRCGEARRAYSLDPTARGPEATPLGLSAVSCAGNETRLTQCRFSISPPSPVGTAWDVGVVCSAAPQPWSNHKSYSWPQFHTLFKPCLLPHTLLAPSPAPEAGDEEQRQSVSTESEGLRLADGPGRCAGRVELLHDGRWGTVCDDSWDLEDAQVVCRQLSCGVALGAFASSGPGPGMGPIWLDELGCAGNESSLWQCPSTGWGRHDCRHKEDVSVLCSEFTDLRLAGGSWACTGRLEVFYNGTWGSVCQYSLPAVALTVICKQLQCGARGEMLARPETDAESSPSWVDDIRCRERHHTSLWQCPSAPWHPHSCLSTEEAWIRCREETDEKNESPEETLKCSVFKNCTAQEKVRLRDGEDDCSGRVEVWHDGSWGTVCDDAWDLADAHVVCRQLGCGVALAALGLAAFGPGKGTIWLDEVRCQGGEASLRDCPAAPWGRTDCGHKEDAAVNCSGERQVTTSPLETEFSPPLPETPEAYSGSEITCIVLGTILCLLLVFLAMEMWNNRCQRRVFRKDVNALPEDIYEEIASSIESNYEEIEETEKYQVTKEFDEFRDTEDMLVDEEKGAAFSDSLKNEVTEEDFQKESRRENYDDVMMAEEEREVDEKMVEEDAKEKATESVTLLKPEDVLESAYDEVGEVSGFEQHACSLPSLEGSQGHSEERSRRTHVLDKSALLPLRRGSVLELEEGGYDDIEFSF